jgi:hypothetical protein
LIAQISAHKADAEFEENHYWHWYRDTLEYLLRSASERGHGGSIILVPKKHVAEALEHIRLGHAVAGFPAVYDTFLDLVRKQTALEQSSRVMLNGNHAITLRGENHALRGKPSPEHIANLKAKITNLLNTLAQITSVDGATILDDYFQPLKFGARLSASEWRGPVRSGPTYSGGSSEENLTGPLRHPA